MSIVKYKKIGVFSVFLNTKSRPLSVFNAFQSAYKINVLSCQSSVYTSLSIICSALRLKRKYRNILCVVNLKIQNVEKIAI